MKNFILIVFVIIFTHSFAQSDYKTLKVPIEIWNDEILVKANVNGIEGTFIWDNGFSKTGIDSIFAEKCQIKKSNITFNATDANNEKVQLKEGICDSFKIGKEIIKNTPIIVVNTFAFTQTKAKKIDGLIGATLINQYNWNFNFDKNYVEISQKTFSGKGIKLPFSIMEESNIHVLDLKINDFKVPCMVDFGYNSDDLAINIQGAGLFKNNKATEEYGITSISVSGFSKIDTTYVIKDKYSLEVANHTFDFLPKVSLSSNTKNALLGNKFFRNKYNVIINCKDKEYILSNREKPLKPSSEKSYGIKLILKNNKFYIGKLFLNPNIKNKELKIMEEVLEINDKQPIYFADNFSLSEYQKEMLNKNNHLTIKLLNGKTYNFTPEYNEEK